jgi:hypothetical protein
MKINRSLPLLLVLIATSAFAQPDTVTIGTYVISVHDINFRDKEYTMRFWLWFLYQNREFNFSKQLDIINAKTIEDPDIIPDSLGHKAWILMKMKATMKESWNVLNFPFDKQHLHVQVENNLFDDSTLVFVPDIKGSQYNSKETIDGWKIRNFRVSTGTNDYHTGFGDNRPGHDIQNFSTFNIDMDIDRDAWGLFMKIFVGMYISFLIAIISFTPHPTELEPRFGLPVGGLFAAVGNKYIIDSLLPESSSFTLVDTLHTLTYLGIFATLVVSAICLNLHDHGKEEACEKMDKYGFRLVVTTYVVANIVFIVLAIL